jgi:proteic killer suppression protein
VIKSFKHKGLKELFEKGISRKIQSSIADKCLRRLDLLDASTAPEDMNVAGFRFHGLNGIPKRYSVRVSANYRITFEWRETDAYRVDLEDYH